MAKWVMAALKRHDISPDAFTEKNPLRPFLVMPDSNQVQ